MTSEIFDFFIQNYVDDMDTLDPASNVKTEPDIEPKIEPKTELETAQEPCTGNCNTVIKSEPMETGIKFDFDQSEPTVPAGKRSQYVYKCRICKKMLESKYAFTCHVNKHKKRCEKCRLTFKTWKQVEDHEQFCSRRYGRIVLPKRFKPSPPINLRFKCQLCYRKYEKKAHLFNHQLLDCSKRYVTPAWIVKI